MNGRYPSVQRVRILPPAEVLVFNTVVVGADDSPTAAEAVRKAIALVKLTAGELHIVTAYKPQRFSSSDAEVDEYLKSIGSDALAESLLAELTSMARAEGIQAEAHALTRAPADAICEVAAQVNADLIVVGNKGMQGVRRVLGSVPNSVAHQAPCDVLIAFTT
jgi:nucleotide-binding universal stress UspA family protein